VFAQAYIQEYGNGKLESEHSDVLETLVRRGIPVQLFTKKKLDRRQLPLDVHSFVAGDHPTIALAMKQLGVAHPALSCYPQSLAPWLKRTVWSTDLRSAMRESGLRPLFIKPLSRTKLFTGFVCHSPADLYKAESASLSTEVYCSEVVDWQAEYRVFVQDGKIAGIRHYAGEVSSELNKHTVEQAIQALQASGEATRGYGIDFGVLANGDTALIEWNDGFALGSYGLDKAIYTDLLLARWEELLQPIKKEM